MPYKLRLVIRWALIIPWLAPIIVLFSPAIAVFWLFDFDETNLFMYMSAVVWQAAVFVAAITWCTAYTGT